MKRQSTEQENIFCNMYIQEILKYKELLQVSNKVKQPVKNGRSLNWHYKDVQMTNMQKTRCFVLFVFGKEIKTHNRIAKVTFQTNKIKNTNNAKCCLWYKSLESYHTFPIGL